ncbi:carbohydrate ABC transporter permease [Candidatus Bipolaricaulota bacterium]|nr:carbohydrate ABC transporter permease [Candidatus Bipolaricaulota bacterium]
MKKKIAATLLIHLMAWVIALIWIVPFLGVFMAAIRPMGEIIRGWWRVDPFTPTFQNFTAAWNHAAAPLAEGMLNSLRVAIPATIVPILVAAIAAYGFSRFRFPLKNYLFIAIVILMTIPQQMIAIPIFRIMNDIGLLNTHAGLILVHAAWGIPWILFFMRNFFTTLPIEVEEAARIDGASDFNIFFRIVLPMSIPALISAVVLQFMWVWNDFFLALILIFSPDKMLATQRIPLLRGVFHVDWGVLAAGTILVMIVPILVFALLQRYYIKGMIGWASK